MTRTKRLDRIVRSMIPVRLVNLDKSIQGTRSGCLINIQNRRFLFTVAHQIHQGQNWAVEVRADYDTGQTELFTPPALHFIYDMNLETGQIGEIDFAYAEIPLTLESFYQEYTPFAGLIREVSRFDVVFDPEVAPNTRSLYGFYGQTLDGMAPAGLQLGAVLEPDLRYVGDEDDLLVFRLPHTHPGHEYYQGCSGAPILDGRGRAIALVVGGDQSNDHIFGVSLEKYAQLALPN